MQTEINHKEHDMWDALNMEYEDAYKNNPYKEALVKDAISRLEPGSRVLDLGCGTGAPVAQMLAAAGMIVVGTDVAPRMVELAKRCCKGEFQVANMIDYEPEGTFDAIFIIYSHLGLTYSAFHAVVSKLVPALSPNGLLAIGQSPADMIEADNPCWDETHTYVSGYDLPFWGKPFATLMFTKVGQRRFLESAGLEVIYDTIDTFQPDNANCAAERQQYIIARRRPGQTVGPPRPLPSRQDN